MHNPHRDSILCAYTHTHNRREYAQSAWQFWQLARSKFRAKLYATNPMAIVVWAKSGIFVCSVSLCASHQQAQRVRGILSQNPIFHPIEGCGYLSYHTCLY